MSDTPRTDARNKIRTDIICDDGHRMERWCVERDFARTLELELNLVTAERDEARLGIQALRQVAYDEVSKLAAEKAALERQWSELAEISIKDQAKVATLDAQNEKFRAALDLAAGVFDELATVIWNEDGCPVEYAEARSAVLEALSEQIWESMRIEL